MKDYRLTLKVQNNYLLTMMQQHGLETASDLSRATGISHARIGGMLNLKKAAYTKKGDVYAAAKELCEFFTCSPEDIFPPQHLEESLPLNKVFIEANRDELMPTHLLEGSVDPLENLLLADDVAEKAEKMEFLYAALDQLTPREQKVLRLRFGFDPDNPKVHSLSKVGEILGVSQERVRQIEIKAMRRMKHRLHRGLLPNLPKAKKTDWAATEIVHFPDGSVEVIFFEVQPKEEDEENAI
jgi:RNA polymerase sigma factor (sigma-70 family)